MSSAKNNNKKLIEAPINSLEELVVRELNNRAEDEPQELWDDEREFGLRLRKDGSWERHPAKPSLEQSHKESPEPEKGSPFDESSVSCDGKPVRTLTNFALYDESGRLVPVEILELLGSGKIVAYGTIVPPSQIIFEKGRCPIPPPAEPWADPYASSVLLQPPPASVPNADDYDFEVGAARLTKEQLIQQRTTRDLLDTLLITPVNVESLKISGVGKQVNRLRRHNDPSIQRRATNVKQTWVDLLERGGSDPVSIDITFLKDAASQLETFVIATEEQGGFEQTLSQPVRKVIVVADDASTQDNQDVEDDNATGNGGGNSRKKAKVSTSTLSGLSGGAATEMIAEYTWNGVAVEPSGPHEARLIQMVDYVRELLNCDESALVGWRMTVHRRKKGDAYGQMDSYFFSPEGRRYRSRNEVGKAFEAGTFGGTGRSSKQATSTPTGKKRPSAPAIPKSPASFSPPPQKQTAVSSTVPTSVMVVEEYDRIDSSESRRPPFEVKVNPPTTLLSARVNRAKAPSNEIVAKRVAEVAQDMQKAKQTIPPLRVCLEVTGWAISTDYGAACLFLHTATAVYRIAGDLVVARPSKWYYPFFCSAFLSLEACRLIVRTITDFSPHIAKLEYSDVMTDVLSRSTRCPGHANDPGLKLIIPTSALRFYFYAYSDHLTADFVVSKQPLIHVLAMRHFASTPQLVTSNPFFSGLATEYTKRFRLEEKALEFNQKDEQRRKLNDKRKERRVELKEKEKIIAIAKRIEQDGDLLPDDLLLSKANLSAVARTITSDPLMIQALELVLHRAPTVSAIRPTPIPLNFDTALLQASDLLEISGQPSLKSKQISSSVNTQVSLGEAERALLSGSIKETQPVAYPDQFGDSFSRQLQIWEGACLFARAQGADHTEEDVGSFVNFRRDLHQGRFSSQIFVHILRAIAREDMASHYPFYNQQYGTGALDPIHDCAFDLTVWPLPEWLINEHTWPVVLQSALCHWLRSNPEIAVLESLECGEVTQFEPDPATDAGLALRDQASPQTLDFIALCDDGLRQLLQDPDSDEFARPVDRDTNPHYYLEITRPMDIGTIRSRIVNGHYDPSKAPPGAYVWDSEKFRTTSANNNDGAKDESDEEDDDDYRHSLNLLELLADYRSGGTGHNADKRPDCGKCKYCLDKPRFGGYNTLRQACILKQQAEQIQTAVASRDASKKNRTKELWKRRQAALAKEEAMTKFDEMYYEHDCLGGGHEGLAADVRLIFRNCRTFNPGTSSLYRAGNKLDSLFTAFYLRNIASRDPKYAIPRVVGLPESVLRDAKRYVAVDREKDDDKLLPRVRRGCPSIITVVKRLSEAGNFASLDLMSKLVSLGWLVDRGLQTLPSEYISSVYSTARGTQENEQFASAVKSLQFEPAGVTSDQQRVWANPRLIRETGGLILLENLSDGKWFYYDDIEQFESFYHSLDPRGRREHGLRKSIEANLEAITTAMKDAAKDSEDAPKELKESIAALHNMIARQQQLTNMLPDARKAADTAREVAIKEAQEKHEQAELARKADIEFRRGQWAEATSPEGKVYYWHTQTKKTQWNRPKEMDLKYEYKPMASLSGPITMQEEQLKSIEAELESLNTALLDQESLVKHAKAKVNRDRAVLKLAYKMKISPNDELKQELAVKGFIGSICALLASILCLENFGLGPGSGEVKGFKGWSNLDDRQAWIGSLKDIASICQERSEGRTQELIAAKLAQSLPVLFDAFVREPSNGKSNAALELPIRNLLLNEEWRWKRSLRASRTFSEIAVLVTHLRRFIPVDFSSSPVVAWEKFTEKEILSIAGIRDIF